MRRMPLPLKLAARQFAREWRASAISAIFLGLPITALIAVNIVSGNEEGCARDECGVRAAGITVGTGAVLLPLVLAVVVMIAASLLVVVRRNERMLALLSSAGASPSTLFQLVSWNGVVTGACAAALAVIAGPPIAWLWLGAVTTFSPITVLGLALLCVALGWVASAVPAMVASAVDANRILRGMPRPQRGEWRTDRIGVVIVGSGAAALIVGTVIARIGQQAYLQQAQPPFWVGAIGGLGASALTGVAPLLMIIGLLLMLPRMFRMIGSATRRFGVAVRLATRDAERQWNRSVSAAAAVLVTTFAISSYISLATMSTADSAENHWWELQEGQFAVSLIDPGYGNAVLDPRTVDDPEGLASRVGDVVDTEGLRILSGVQGPYYGTPVEDIERYSGRQEMSFPAEGLPHPRIPEKNICGVEQIAGWRCEPLPYYHPLAFPLDARTPTIWVGDNEDLRLILGGVVDDSTLDALDRGDALVLDARYLSADGMVTIDWHDSDFVPENEPGEFLPSGKPLRSETLPGQLVPLEHRLDYGVFLSERAADALGLTAEPARLLGAFSDPPVASDSYDAYLSLGDAAGGTAEILIESGPSEPEPGWITGALLLSGGITLAVTLVAVGLARVDGRATDRTLAALGADPGTRRRISGLYALVVVGTASILGTAVGIAGASSSMVSFGGSIAALPWRELGILALVGPLAAAGLTLLAPPAATARARTSPRQTPPPH
jgi:putative ABC transport system permease protein